MGVDDGECHEDVGGAWWEERGEVLKFLDKQTPESEHIAFEP